MTRAHSEFSPSSAYRWLACPGSVGLSREVPPAPDGGWYAERGTKAHSLAETMLERWNTIGRPATAHPEVFEDLRPAPEVEIKLMAWETAAPKDLDPDAEMFEHVLGYVQFVADMVHSFDSPAAEVSLCVERTLQLNDDPLMFGTIDGFAVGADGEGYAVRMADLKYGTSPVKAEGNPQLAYYACMVAKNSRRHIDRAELSIYQPRLKRARKSETVVYDRASLDQWHERLVVGAEKARRQADGLEPREFVAGKHCFFCTAREHCGPRREYEANKKALKEISK